MPSESGRVRHLLGGARVARNRGVRLIRKEEEIVPALVEQDQRFVEREDRQVLAIPLQQTKAFKLGQRVVDFEIDIGVEARFQPEDSDLRIQRFLIGRIACGKQEIVGEEGFLAFLLLGCADDVIENSRIVADVAKIAVIGDLLLVLERKRSYLSRWRMIKPPSAAMPLSAASDFTTCSCSTGPVSPR